jgi:type I restriction-modification system DNA methylase subunit
MIDILGKKYQRENIESGEWSYSQWMQGKATGHYKLDLRFSNDKMSILIETKKSFKDSDKKQLFDYVAHEKNMGTKNIIAILADTQEKSKRIKVWKVQGDAEELLEAEQQLRPFEEYVAMFSISTVNDKQKIMQATYELNELLHNYLNEKIRAQFVGTCLLALKNDLVYQGLSNSQIRSGIKDILSRLLSKNINKAEKLALLNTNVLETDDVRQINDEKFGEILDNIRENIYPYINETTNQGQDLLNLFFTTFNKYVGKADKNQAFTPDHIVHFMTKVARVNKNSVVLDPTCGSGAFLVQAMVQAMDDCATESEKNHVKEKQIYGIELDSVAFGLSTTNMLIHGDGNSNIYRNSCFDKLSDLKDKKIDIVLMNPPYNAKPKDVPERISKDWNTKKKGKEKATTDPSKGFCFVYETAKYVQKGGKLLCLLPLACAIGQNKEIRDYKERMLEKHTLDAVFSLPTDIFHPGASANVCCMVFTIGQAHPKNFNTFFGYYKNDGFVKKKNLGRVDINSGWEAVEAQWLDLYFNRDEVAGLSVRYNISPDNRFEDYKKEWLAEAYMETDYSSLTTARFEETIRNYLAYGIISGRE